MYRDKMFPEYIQGHVLNLIQSLHSTPIQNNLITKTDSSRRAEHFMAYLFLEKHLRKLNCDEE